MDFAILFTSKENFPRRDGAAPRGPTRGGSGRADQRWLRRDFPGSGQRDLPVTPDVGNCGTKERDFGFVPIRGGGHLAELYAEPTTTGAAASGGQRALLIRIVR